jgi:hypothetical protein
MLYLSSNEPVLTAVDFRNVRLGEIGWISCDVPGLDGGILYESQLGARSDWFDLTAQIVREGGASIASFNRVAPRFRRQLSRPLWAFSTLNDVGRAYASIGYSAGAAEWARRGGELRQLGVDNIRFRIPAPTGNDEAPRPTKERR